MTIVPIDRNVITRVKSGRISLTDDQYKVRPEGSNTDHLSLIRPFC